MCCVRIFSATFEVNRMWTPTDRALRVKVLAPRIVGIFLVATDDEKWRFAIDDLQIEINSVGVQVSFIQQEVINKVKNHLAVLIPWRSFLVPRNAKFLIRQTVIEFVLASNFSGLPFAFAN